MTSKKCLTARSSAHNNSNNISINNSNGLQINESNSNPPDLPSALCSRIENQSYRDEQNLSDLTEFLNKSNSKPQEKRLNDVKKTSNIHQPSNNLNNDIINKITLKDKPNFFALLLNANDPIPSPIINNQKESEIFKKKNTKKKGSIISLHKNNTNITKTPIKDNENNELSRQNISVKVKLNIDNEFIGDSQTEESSDSEKDYNISNKDNNIIKDEPTKKMVFEKRKTMKEENKPKEFSENKRKSEFLPRKEVPNPNRIEILQKNEFLTKNNIPNTKIKTKESSNMKENIFNSKNTIIENENTATNSKRTTNNRKSFGNLKDELQRLETKLQENFQNSINQNSIIEPSTLVTNVEMDDSVNHKKKKNKRVSLEEKLNERFRKLAEEKQKRTYSVYSKASDNKPGLKINDFLDQKFKELRLQKISNNKDKAIVVKSEENLVLKIEHPQKKCQSLENITFQNKLIQPKFKSKTQKINSNKGKTKNSFNSNTRKTMNEIDNPSNNDKFNESTTNKSDLNHSTPPKSQNNEEKEFESIDIVYKKSRKSIKPTTSISILSDIKNRSKSCFYTLLINPKTQNNNSIIESNKIFKGDPLLSEKKQEIISDSNHIYEKIPEKKEELFSLSKPIFHEKVPLEIVEDIPDRKILEEKKIFTPTFEKLQENLNSYDINEEKIEKKIIVRNLNSSDYDTSKKKSNLKSNVSSKSRSRSVAFKVENFANILEFDETETSLAIKPQENDIISNADSKNDDNSISKSENIDETLVNSERNQIICENTSKLTINDLSQSYYENPSELTITLTPQNPQIHEEIYEKPELVLKKPIKNRSFSVERPMRLQEDDKGFKSSDEALEKKRSQTHKSSNFREKLKSSEEILEVSNENSPISNPINPNLINSIKEPKEFQMKEIGKVSNKNENSPKKLSITENSPKKLSINDNLPKKSLKQLKETETDRKSLIKPKSSVINTKRPSSVQFIREEDLFAFEEKYNNEDNLDDEEESSGDDLSSQESDGRKIFSDAYIRENIPEKHSKFKKLIKPEKKAPIRSENEETQKEEEEIKKIKIDTKSQVKSLFETKKTLEKRPIPQRKKAKTPIKNNNFNKEMEQIERTLNEEIIKVELIREKAKNFVPLSRTTKKKTPKKDIKPVISHNMPSYIKTEDKKLMEEILLFEAKLQGIIDKISIKTFLWVKTIIRPHEEVYKISKSLLHLIIINSKTKLEMNHWKKIQVFFLSPSDLINCIQTYKQNVYQNKIPIENYEKSLENLIDPDNLNSSLKESKIFEEYFLLVHDFLINAHKFYNLVQKLHRNLSFYIENPILEKFLTKARCENLNDPYIIKSPEKIIKRSKTPDCDSLKWKLGDKKEELSIDLKRKPKGDSIIMEIIEKSFDKKINKAHCFVYEERDQDIEKSWKELLNLRSEITKLLWEEERRVKKHKEKDEINKKSKEIEFNLLQKKELNEYLNEKDKEERKFLQEMKNAMFKDEIEAKNESLINKKINMFDDLQRSSENLNKSKAFREEYKLNSKLEFKEKKNEKIENKYSKIEQKIDKESDNMENLLRIQKEERNWKLKKLELNKKELKNTLNNLKTLIHNQ